MKKKLTKEKFAEWLFEDDRKNGLYNKKKQFSNLPASEKELYIDEASYYLTGNSPLGLPTNIVERAKAEGYELS